MRGIAILVVSLMILASCSKGAGPANDRKGPQKDIAFPVQVQPVESRQVEYVIAAIGTVAAFEEVSITSRVTGVVETVKFQEGDKVKEGDILVEIEPRRFQLAVAQAQAQLDRAAAAVKDAESFLARREAMVNEGVVSADEMQTVRTRAATAKADQAAARAALGLAQLNLRDAYVRSPISGTVQTRMARTGQYAQPGVVLATLLRSDPMLLRFEVPEADGIRVRTGMVARFTVQGLPQTLDAKITHVAASANVQSRMVPVVAEVTSPPPELRAGSFAEVTVPVGATTDAPVIPETAIRPSDRGFLSFVVDGGKAHERVLTLGMRTADGQVEVRSGLKPGETLVVRGSEALTEGVNVRIEAPGAGPPPAGGAKAAASGTAAAGAPGTGGPVAPASAGATGGPAAPGSGAASAGSGSPSRSSGSSP